MERGSGPVSYEGYKHTPRKSHPWHGTKKIDPIIKEWAREQTIDPTPNKVLRKSENKQNGIL